MKERHPPDLEMTINGEFVSPPVAPITSRILMWAIVIALVAGALSLAAFALWIALIILPVAFGAAVVAWAMFRYRVWQAQRSMAAQTGIRRP
jgi:membrane protein implicated in regulation of membrane protease activity